MSDSDHRNQLRSVGEQTRDAARFIFEEYKIAVYISGAALGVLLLSGRLGLPSIPRFWTLVLTAHVVGIIPTILIAERTIIDRFVPDPRELIIEADPHGGLSITPHRVPSSLWRDRTHTHDLPVHNPEGTNYKIVSKYSLEDGEIFVRGISEEIADPISIAYRDGRLEEIYEELLDDRRELQHLKATANLQQHEIESHVVNSLVGAIEESVAFDPASSVGSGGDLFGDPRGETAHERSEQQESEQQQQESEQQQIIERFGSLISNGDSGNLKND